MCLLSSDVQFIWIPFSLARYLSFLLALFRSKFLSRRFVQDLLVQKKNGKLKLGSKCISKIQVHRIGRNLFIKKIRFKKSIKTWHFPSASHAPFHCMRRSNRQYECVLIANPFGSDSKFLFTEKTIVSQAGWSFIWDRGEKRSNQRLRLEIVWILKKNLIIFVELHTLQL